MAIYKLMSMSRVPMRSLLLDQRRLVIVPVHFMHSGKMIVVFVVLVLVMKDHRHSNKQRRQKRKDKSLKECDENLQ